MPKNPHDRHRQRVRREFFENGFTDATPEHKVIEMLLFFGLPRGDTNVTAHRLLDKFGNIAGILEATPQELMSVNGIGENCAALIKLMLPLFRAYRNDKNNSGKNIPQTMDYVCDFVIKKHFGFTEEVFGITTFNSKGSIIDFDIVSSGDVSSVGVSTRSVVEVIIKRKAVCAVISHNHPNGNALPSNDDIKMTVRIQTALSHIGVKLMDHIIVANDDCVSLAQSPQYCDLFESCD